MTVSTPIQILLPHLSIARDTGVSVVDWVKSHESA